jgi:hypothetical protein
MPKRLKLEGGFISEVPEKPPKLKVVKRRKRSTSLEAQLRREAAKIYESGMAQAYNAAVGQMLVRKIDEVLQLAAVTGYRMDAGALPIGQMQRSAPPPPKPAVENPCVQCGQEGVYKTKRNHFNLTGSWYCRAHQKMGGMTDAEDQLDRALLGAQAPVTKPAPAVVVAAAPVEMVKQGAPPPPADPLLAAMGMAKEA